MSAKVSMTCMAFPPIVFWVLIRFGNTYYHILIARSLIQSKNRILSKYLFSYGDYNQILFSSRKSNRFIAGLTGGGYQSGTVQYVSEISNNK